MPTIRAALGTVVLPLSFSPALPGPCRACTAALWPQACLGLDPGFCEMGLAAVPRSTLQPSGRADCAVGGNRRALTQGVGPALGGGVFSPSSRHCSPLPLFSWISISMTPQRKRPSISERAFSTGCVRGTAEQSGKQSLLSSEVDVAAEHSL